MYINTSDGVFAGSLPSLIQENILQAYGKFDGVKVWEQYFCVCHGVMGVQTLIGQGTVLDVHAVHDL